MKKSGIMNKKALGWISVMALMVGLLLWGASPAISEDADCSNAVNLADVPLELKSKAAPGLISLVLENTRSLYYTIMVTEGVGTYNINGNHYANVFDDGDDRAGAKALDTNANRNHWKTQWNGYNTVYYEPNATYVPWPRWNSLEVPYKKSDALPAKEAADPDNPRPDPLFADSFDMNAQFSTVSSGAAPPPPPPPAGSINPWGKARYWLGSYDGYAYAEVDQGQKSDWVESIKTYNKPRNVTVVSVWIQSADSLKPIALDTIRLVNSKGGQYHSKDPENLPVITYYYPVDWQTHNDAALPDNEYIIDLTKGNPTRSFKKATAASFAWVKIDFMVPKQADTLTLDVFVPYYKTPIIEEPPEEPPVVVGDVSIKNAHYYVESSNGKIYLVNMVGPAASGAAAYYEVKDPTKITIETTADLIPVAAPPADILIADYAQARQNFANWYQFYRSRAYAAIGGLGQVLEKLTNAYFRLDGFPPASFGEVAEPIDVVVNGKPYNDRDTVLSNLYSLQPPQAETVGKLHSAYERTGDWFINKNGTNLGKEDESFSLYSTSALFPWFTKENGGECQQAFVILVTGGFWTTKDNELRLADMAKNYWDTDMRDPDLDNFVPINNMDDNPRQHVVTYGISFGVDGAIVPPANEWTNCNLPGGFVCPTWPEKPLTQSNETIDDLWHATVEGRGLFVNAKNPQAMVTALKDIFSDIERRIGAAAAVSTNSVQRLTGTHLYQGSYNSTLWSGNLKALSIDTGTGEVSRDEDGNLKALWEAQDVLDNKTAWEDRNIFTYSGAPIGGGGTGLPFLYDSLTATQKSQLDPEPDPALNQGRDMVDYLWGDRDLELKKGGPFRNRASRLGDIVHSEPVYHQGVIYIGANDGMLHAFDASDGKELFAYVPNMVFGHLAELTDLTYDHKYYVNNTPYAKSIPYKPTLLVGGLSKGGKGYYCLDISNPKSFIASDVKWEYSAEVEGDKDLGYSFSRAFIVDTKAAGWVVIFGNGYNSVNGEAVLYVLDAATGKEVKKIHTGVFGCNGIVAPPAIIDPNSDLKADYVYVGDLKGNMWKFDISGESVEEDWGVAFMEGGTPIPLFTARSVDGDIQPITAMADVMRHCIDNRHGYMVIFGTGQYVNEGDFDDMTRQSLYAVWDTQPAWVYLGTDPKDKYLGEFKTDRSLSNPAWTGYTLLQQKQGDKQYLGKYYTMSSEEINYWYIDDTGEHVGWYFDLPFNGQRLIRDPMIRDGIVVFIGTVPTQTPCSSGGTSILYQLDACSGGAAVKPVFDVNGSGRVDSDDVIKDGEDLIIPSGVLIDTMLYRPVDIKDRLYLSDDSADVNEVVVRPALGGMTYWRETDIRR